MRSNVRQSNFELMRIVSMLFIIIWHIILHGGIINCTGTLKLVIDFVFFFVVVHVNSFVLLTGYFQCEKKFSLKKFFVIFKTAWFYKAVIALILCFFGLYSFSKVDLLKELLPLDFWNYWYVICYLVLYLISPWLNKLILVMPQKEYKKLLFIMFLLFSIIPYISNQVVLKNNGFTVVQFVFMYFIGGYLKKYPLNENYHLKNWSVHKKQFFYIIMFFSFFFFNFLIFQFAGVLLSFPNSLLQEIGTYFLNAKSIYSNPFIVMQSVFYFLFFSTLNFRNRKINFISKVVLDVYFVHDNLYVKPIFYNFIRTSSWFSLGPVNVLLLIFLFTLLIFIIGIGIGLVRYYLFLFIDKRKWVIRFKNWFYKYLDEF